MLIHEVTLNIYLLALIVVLAAACRFWFPGETDREEP